VKVDRRLEVLDVPEPQRRLVHPLDGGVHGLEAGIGQPVPEVGEDVREVALNELGHLDHRRQLAVGGAPEPASEERRRVSMTVQFSALSAIDCPQGDGAKTGCAKQHDSHRALCSLYVGTKLR